MVLSPAFLMQAPLVDFLNKNLEQKLRTLDLNDVIDSDKIIPPKFQQALFLTIGLTLEQALTDELKRNREKAYATAS